MDVLPRFLYLFQALPLPVPRSFFVQLQAAFRKFVWGALRPRLQLKSLTRLKGDGGAGLPDVYLYYRATVLMRIVDWFHSSQTKQWVTLEASLTPLSLRSLPWVLPASRPAPALLTPLTRHFLAVWDHAIRVWGVSRRPGLMSPLFDNPSFPPAVGRESFLVWSASGGVRLQDVFSGGVSLPSFSELQSRDPERRLSWLEYVQLRDFLASCFPQGPPRTSPLPVEVLLRQSDAPVRILSQLYRILLSCAAAPTLSYVTAWNRDLGTRSDKEWQRCFDLTHRLSIPCSAQEKNFKILSRWYRCPDLLHRCFPGVSDLCWRCGSDVGSFLHIWWACPLIQTFWQSVFMVYSEMSGKRFSPTPEIALLSMLPGPWKLVKRGLLRHFLTAARTVIPRHWRTPEPPSVNEWVAELDLIRRMELLVGDAHGSGVQVQKSWLVWDLYRASDRLAAHLT